MPERIISPAPRSLANTLGALLLQAARDAAGLPSAASSGDSLWLNYHEQHLVEREIENGSIIAWRANSNWHVPRAQFIPETLQPHPAIQSLRRLGSATALAASYEAADYTAAWWTSVTLWHVPEAGGGYTPLLDCLQRLDPAAANPALERLLPPNIMAFYSDRQAVYRLFQDDAGLLDEFVLQPEDRRRLPSCSRFTQARQGRALSAPRPDYPTPNGANGQPAEVPAVGAAREIITQNVELSVA